jgi:hypothetical protein
MGSITQAEASLVLCVLEHARDDEPRQRLRRVLQPMEHADSAFRAISISRSEARLVWEDIVALRHLFGAEEQPALDSLKARLAAIMRAQSPAVSPRALPPKDRRRARLSDALSAVLVPAHEPERSRRRGGRCRGRR